MIDRYIAELDGALRGPRHAKADLITEARDSLVDAAEAYEGRGLSREAAQRRAVCEFGEVREIASGYQTELGLTQARRTALLVFFALVTQTVLAEYAWRSAAAGGIRRPVPGYVFLAELVDRLSVA
ncbi:MAG TPA: permease prefix domain 1-containing protein, partial [Pilimelia sp.]|nr:permease prefix domain 1-containing protein [Pilimelia sp.]